MWRRQQAGGSQANWAVWHEVRRGLGCLGWALPTAMWAPGSLEPLIFKDTGRLPFYGLSFEF
jgi:hypothetical protein